MPPYSLVGELPAKKTLVDISGDWLHVSQLPLWPLTGESEAGAIGW